MITFNNIVERFKVFADAHFFVKSFSFGSPDDVDLSKFTSFPLMHLVYTGATYDAGTKTYNLEVYILDVPADKTKKVDRQKEVVSDAEQCAEDIIADIKNGGNIFLFAQDYEVVNATTTPLEEETKNVLSGVLLDLSVAIPYEWDACNAPIDGVTPEGGDEVAYARRGVLRMLTQDGSTDVLSVRTIKVTNGTLTDDGDGTVTLDTGGVNTLGDLNDVNVDDPSGGQSIMWDGGLDLWVKDSRTTVLYEQLKEGSETSIKNGARTESELKLEQTKATVQTGITKVVLTETSPGDIEFVVATDADGDTAFTALHLDGSSTANVADLLVKFGTYLKLEDGNFTQWIRPSSGATQNTTIVLPSTSGVLGRAEDIPTSVTNLTDVTSAGSGAIITDAERTNLTANTAKVGLIAGGTTGQALVKSTGTDYDVEWADIAVDVQYHDRYATESETLRAGGTETIELYYSAQADGDGLAQSAQTDTPTAGYDIRRKLYYSEAGFADPDTGTWTQFTAIADNTTYANAKAALLAYLKERTGGTVPISLKMTWEEVAEAPAFTGLLNESYGSGAEAAYSTRRLNGNVTDCMVIRRASDSTTTTIGFDGSGNIDESAIETFCTGTTCTVVTWKDQSGNGNDATAAASGNEPTIYTGGALVKENGKVALDFDGADDYIQWTSFTISQPLTAFGVQKLLTSRTGISGTATGLLTRSNTDLHQIYLGTSLQSTVNYLDARQLISNIGNSTSSYIYSDGVEVANGDAGTGSASIETYPTNALVSIYSEGTAQELIFYASDKSSVRTDIESNIADYFTQNTPLLDTYTGAAAAYSLRKLRTAYTGSAVEVYNGSSYADIGFNVFGELDTVALAAHCGSNDGFVSKWYDQAGSNDATQTTTSKMPKIYDGTTGVTLNSNSKPAVYFQDNVSNVMNVSTGYASDPYFITAVSEVPTGVTDGRSDIYSNGSLLNIPNGIRLLNWENSFVGLWNGDGSSLDQNQKTETATLDTTILITGYNVSGNMYIFRDGVAGSNNPVSTSISTTQTSGFIHGNRDTRPNYIAEIVIYDSDQSSNRSGIESNIATYHGITI